MRLWLHNGGWLRHVPGQEIVQRRHIGRTLNGGMPAQGHNASARTPNIAEQQLDDGGGADNLHALRLLGPANRVTDGGCALPPRILDQGLRNLQPLFARHTAHLFYHLRCIAREMAAHYLEYTAWMLQRRVAQWPPVFVPFIIPTALISIRPRVRIVAREQAIQLFGILKILAYQRGGVGVMHDVVMEVAIVLEQVANNRSQEDDVAARARRHVEIRQRRRA